MKTRFDFWIVLRAAFGKFSKCSFKSIIWISFLLYSAKHSAVIIFFLNLSIFPSSAIKKKDFASRSLVETGGNPFIKITGKISMHHSLTRTNYK